MNEMHISQFNIQFELKNSSMEQKIISKFKYAKLIVSVSKIDILEITSQYFLKIKH